MEGTVVASQLSSSGRTAPGDGIRFELAGPRHDAGLRRLLRDNPMPGQINVSLEREPNYFAAAAKEGSEIQTIVATQSDRVICAGSFSIRQRFVNGSPIRVGYLGGLRLDASCRGKTSVIRRGYDLFRQLHEQGGPPIYFTSIVSENFPARRLLERGLDGMPTYRFLGEFVTLVIPRRRRNDLRKPTSHVRRNYRKWGLTLTYGSQEHAAQIANLLNADYRKYQFSPVWSASELHPEDFRIVNSEDGNPVACAAIWDQREFKQAIVRGYANRIRWTRPLFNLAAAFTGWPALPRIGQPIPQAFVSHLAVDPLRPQLAEWLIRLLHGAAHTRNIDYLTIGFDAQDPRLTHLRKVFKPREYVSRLYVVHWDDGAKLAANLDTRLLLPEAALL